MLYGAKVSRPCMFLSRTTILGIKVVGPPNFNFNLGIVFGITETFEAHHETDCSSVDALFLDYCAHLVYNNLATQISTIYSQ